MSYIIDTLLQNVGESPADFVTRVETYISDQYYYFVNAGGVFPIPTTGAGGPSSWLGYPPIEPTSDTTTWDVANAQLRRTVSFSYENTYYFKFLGITPTIPPPSPLPTAGDLAMFGPLGTVTDTGFAVDLILGTVNWAGTRQINAANGINPQDLVTMAQIAGFGAGTVTSVSVVTANGFAGTVATATTTPAITITTTITGVLKGNGTAISAAVDADITAFALTGYVVGANTALAATDSILVAFEKVQGQINAIPVTGGTVTSVGLALPADFTITVSPITTSGTLTATWTAVSPFLVLAGPNIAGPNAAPTFRSLVAGDIPSLPYTTSILASGHIFVGSAGNVAIEQALTLNASAGAFALSNAGVLTMPDAATATRGLLNSTDWNTFNGKQDAISFGTGVLTALGVNVGSAGAFVVNGGDLGTPSGGVGTNITGITAAHIVAGTFGTGAYAMDTSLAVPQILLPATSGSTAGVIYQNAVRFIHSFGTANSFIGSGSGNFTLTGANNTGIGYQSLNAISAGANNVGIGYSALGAVTNGASNLGIGTTALKNLNTGSNNIAIGYEALYSTNGSYNIAIGAEGLLSTGGSRNISIGYYSGSYETGSNSFYINNINQVNTAGDKAYSLLYGTFAGSAGTITGNALNVNGILRAANYVTFDKSIYVQDTITPFHYWKGDMISGTLTWTDTGSTTRP